MCSQSDNGLPLLVLLVRVQLTRLRRSHAFEHSRPLFSVLTLFDYYR
jgi:hypothetical protein